MRWLDSIPESMDMNLSKVQEIVDRGAWWAAFREVAKSRTRLSNWTTTTTAFYKRIHYISVSESLLYTRNQRRDFPAGPVVKNPPSNAGDVGSIPGEGTKIPHAVEQLSWSAATAEPASSRACAPQLEETLHAVTRKSPSASLKTQRSQN